MARPYQHRSTPRVPAKVDDIQVNFCRNSGCANFGVPPEPTVKKGRNSQDRDGYRLVGGWKSTTAKQSMICLLCNESFTVQSNRAIVEERDRLLAPFVTVSAAQCPRAACASRLLNVVDHPKAYIRFGSTHSGSPRYRCKRCGTTFSVPARSTLRQRLPQKSPLILSLLINKSPMRRICEVAGIRPETLYQRIDFFYRQCVKVAQTHERLLLAGKSFDRLHIAVDRQDHTLNWGSHLDRRNVVLRAIASADSKSGYVFGVHLNYDPTMDPQEIELMARERGDFDVGLPFREFARVWLASQYHVHPSSEETPSPSKQDVKPPSLGMQVHEEYTQFGHFLYLERLLRGAKRLQFSLDQEPSIRAACLVAFQDRARARTLDAFYVRINKVMTIDEKKLALAQSETLLRQIAAQFPGHDDVHVALHILKERYQQAVAMHSKWQNRWVAHPLPNMNEPEKAVLCLTDTGHYDAEILARAYARASLNAIDRFFMLVRRRVSLFERPIATSSRAGRVWHGYQGYNPQITAKILEIFRVAHNYVLTGEAKTTPAQRLGLAEKPWSLEDVLAFHHTD